VYDESSVPVYNRTSQWVPEGTPVQIIEAKYVHKEFQYPYFIKYVKPEYKNELQNGTYIDGKESSPIPTGHEHRAGSWKFIVKMENGTEKSFNDGEYYFVVDKPSPYKHGGRRKTNHRRNRKSKTRRNHKSKK